MLNRGDRIEKSNQLLTQLESLMGSESMVKSASTDPSLQFHTHTGPNTSPQATLMRRLQQTNLPPTLPNQLTTHHYTNNRHQFIPPSRMERRGGNLAMPVSVDDNAISFAPHLVNSQTNDHLAHL